MQCPQNATFCAIFKHCEGRLKTAPPGAARFRRSLWTCDKKERRKGQFLSPSVCLRLLLNWVQSPLPPHPQKYLDTFVNENIRPKLLKLGKKDKECCLSENSVYELHLPAFRAFRKHKTHSGSKSKLKYINLSTQYGWGLNRPVQVSVSRYILDTVSRYIPDTVSRYKIQYIDTRYST